jgi:ferritin-like metal-binding protein YciE
VPGIIGVSQAIEHYEMARYGTLMAWARQLGMMEATTRLLEETLKQEKKADATLNDSPCRRSTARRPSKVAIPLAQVGPAGRLG